VMRALLCLAVFVSLLNCPVILLTLDDSHSVAVINEHGVEHLVFFHSPDADKHAADAMFRAEVNQENHEVHLQDTTGLLRHKVQVSPLAKDLRATSNPLMVQTSSTHGEEAPIEPDVGTLHRPVHILRI
jgi:hypothetical protein